MCSSDLGYPSRLEGRDAIREYLRGYPEIVDVRSFPAKVVHETVDPEVVIVEFEAEGVAARTSKPYRLGYIAVIAVRDGEIRNYRDYWSPLAAAEVVGGAAELMAAFAGGDRA